MVQRYFAYIHFVLAVLFAVLLVESVVNGRGAFWGAWDGFFLATNIYGGITAWGRANDE